MDWREKIQTMEEMEPLTNPERDDFYAQIGELLEGGMDEDDAAYLVFGEEPAYTFTRNF